MDVTFSAAAPCSPTELFAWVDDLGRYPRWMDLVHAATPVDGTDAEWETELRARVGPLTRSKRLRMRRTLHRVGGDGRPWMVRFERDERDQRRHAPWILQATVTGTGEQSALDMALHYGGSLWTGGLLERVLDDHVQRGRQRLISLVTPTPSAARSDVD